MEGTGEALDKEVRKDLEGDKEVERADGVWGTLADDITFPTI